MKRLTIFALIFVLALSVLAGCRSRREDTAGTTNTTAATGVLPDNGDILPDTGDMLPDPEDMMPESTVDPTNGADDGMVDPTNGANQDATDSTADTTAPNRSRRHPMR